MSSIQNAMQALGYVRMATHAGDTCRGCAHAEPRSTGLRCVKGFFYVSPAGSCTEFAPASRPTTSTPADRRVS